MRTERDKPDLRQDEQPETLFLGRISQMLHYQIIGDVSGQTHTHPPLLIIQPRTNVNLPLLSELAAIETVADITGCVCFWAPLDLSKF